MISIILTYNDLNIDYTSTINNLKKQIKTIPGAKLIILNLTNLSLTLENNLEVYNLFNYSIPEAYNIIIKNLTTQYAVFTKSTINFPKYSLKKACHLFKKNNNSWSLFYFYPIYNNAKSLPSYNTTIDLSVTPNQLPIEFYSTIFKSSFLKQYTFNTSVLYDWDFECLMNALLENQSYYISKIKLTINENSKFNYSNYPPSQDHLWYNEVLINSYIQMLQKINNVPLFIQYGIYHNITLRFNHNLNTRDKHLFKDPQNEFFLHCQKVLSYVNDIVLLDNNTYIYNISNILKMFLIKLKYNFQIQQTFTFFTEENYFSVNYNNIPLANIASKSITIDSINFSEKTLIIETSMNVLVEEEKIKLFAKLNGEVINLCDTDRFANTSFFDVEIYKTLTSILEIPYEKLIQDNNSLFFYYEFLGKEFSLKIKTSRFPARINKFISSYWCFNNYIICYAKHKSNLIIKKNTKTTHIFSELRYLATIFTKSKRMFILRLLYWFTFPLLHTKNIWITFDKLYKGGDNGEYFYKYVINQQNENLDMHYIINKNYPDAMRLESEGFKPLYFNTLKQKLYFLNSKIVAATHANIPVFSGIKPAGFKYVQDLFNAEVVCIQHGLSVQNLSHNMNQQYDNLKKIFLASRYELNNLSLPIYGYYNDSSFNITGVPRYDGLISNDKKQILITPTWRSYISMPTCIGNVRPYSNTFKETIYYKIYNSLITNDKLIECAKNNNYTIVYLLHPTISSQIDDFYSSEFVKLVSPINANYEQLLTESSLMITDYSGVQFDFAYMRKPILYYHPTELPPHYEEGGFLYDTMGFGEICTTESELVDNLCNYIKNECKTNDFYLKRIDDFFEFSDQNNCKRIYNVLTEYQNSIK